MTAQRRLTWTLFAGVALGTSGVFATITSGSLAAEEIAGPAWSGLPGTTTILGAAAGSLLVSRIAGRRRGLSIGYLIAASGGIIAVTAMRAAALPMLLAGTFLIGVGNSSNQLARYAAADLHPPDRRGSALGLVVWAGTVGALVGPNVLAPSGALAVSAGAPRLAGPFAASFVLVIAAGMLYIAALRPDPATLAFAAADRIASRSWRTPAVQVGVASIATAQTVMVLVMTMTPVHIRHAGHGLGIVGLVLSAHVVGMYALSPVVGRLGDRYGPATVVLWGQGLLLVSVLAAAALSGGGGVLLSIPLLGLGVGWSTAFVSGSALIAASAGPRAQGSADTIVWLSGAAAAAASGAIVSVSGYLALCFVAAGLTAVPALAIALRARALAQPVISTASQAMRSPISSSE